MDGQNQPEQNAQPEQLEQNVQEQTTNPIQSQQSGIGEQQNGGFSGFSGFYIPLNFTFSEQDDNNQTSTSPQPSSTDNGPRQQPQVQFLHFFIHPMSGTQGNNATTSGTFFFTPLFMPQQEVRKPRASESAMKMLPTVVITKEHADTQASCPICLEPFASSLEQENKTDETKHEPVRQMPCNHMFCESCLFQWLRQNNSCPLCRKEIEAEGVQQQEVQQEVNSDIVNNDTVSVPPNPNIPSIPSPSSPTTTSNVTTTNFHRHSNSISCALASVGCCEEIDDSAQTRTPIITLPQCHHRFHVSCLRTSLLVEGYSLGDFNLTSQPLNFHCPTCRAPAIVQSDVLKMPAVLQDERRQEQLFNLPLTIHIPDSNDMDLD